VKKKSLFKKKKIEDDGSGEIFESELDWKAHLEIRMRKACIAYCSCRRAVGKTWGLSPKVVAWLYTSVVRPILSYNSLV
jgi:hypothetical protein